MTLLEILVKELPGLGGWPKDSDDELTISDRLPKIYWNFYETYKAAYTNAKELVTREQYEAALAESKKVAWNGEGLPPVGCECEIKRVTDWMPVTIKYISGSYTIFKTLGGTEVCYETHSLQFRPVLSEEERRRDEITGAIGACIMFAYDDNSDKTTEDHLYDAIAAGKIPHIKIV